MTADQFLEFVASLPPEKQVGIRNKLSHLLDTARTIRDIHGLSLDPITRINTTAKA